MTDEENQTDEALAESSDAHPGFFARVGSDLHAIKAWFHRRISALETRVKALEDAQR